MYEASAQWTMVGPDGTTIQFNNGGYLLDDVGGFDSPNVRQTVEDIPERDGAIAGNFYFSSRPVTFSGLLNFDTAASRNLAIATLQQAVRGLRGDVTITTQPQGLPAMQATARFESLRLQPGFKKRFTLTMVCPDPRFYSQALNTITVSAVPATAGAQFPLVFPINFGGGSGSSALAAVSNAGNIDTYPTFRITGPITNPQVKNASTGQSIYVDNLVLAGGEYVDIDTVRRTVTTSWGANIYDRVRFPSSVFWALRPGSNNVELWASASSSGRSLAITWRDAWA